MEFVSGTSLAQTTALSLEGGTDGEEVSGLDYFNFLEKIEKFVFDILCCSSDDSQTIDLFKAYTLRMNEETGANFQLVCYRAENADNENIIVLDNKSRTSEKEYELVYWLSGAQASCEIGNSITGKVYDGELLIDVNYSQSHLKEKLSQGLFVFHSVNSRIRVLRDINSFTSFTVDKGVDFSSNQTVRVCFALANSVASLFNTKYLGLVANDKSGRMSLWNDVCKILEDLQSVRAITEFATSDVVIEQGQAKSNVVCSIKKLVVAGAMEALYMNVVLM